MELSECLISSRLLIWVAHYPKIYGEKDYMSVLLKTIRLALLFKIRFLKYKSY